jgi:hypothetical protein
LNKQASDIINFAHKLPSKKIDHTTDLCWWIFNVHRARGALLSRSEKAARASGDVKNFN